MVKMYEVFAVGVSRSTSHRDVIARVDTFTSREKADEFISARKQDATPFQQAAIDYLVKEVEVR